MARAKTIALGRHRGDRLLRHRAAGDADVDVGARQRVGQRARCSPARLVFAASACLIGGQVVAAGVQDARAVGDRDVADAGLEQDLVHGDAGRAGAGDDHPQVGRACGRSAAAALRSAASTTTAVPCWSSWKTGMSSRS